MQDLETNVAKIELGNPKQATAYVFLTAEKGPNDSELFVVCELPLFNPAAREECERLSEAIAASLRRSLKKPFGETSFENALSQVNEELGKLASLGKTHWVGKLNALLAVRIGDSVSIATTGKITALLLRDGDFNQISETSKPSHLLKTFENFSVGKIKLGDALIFSTSQLLNYISLDRMKVMLEERGLVRGVREIMRVLQDTAGPEIAFGTIVAQLLEPGSQNIALEPEDETEQTASQTAVGPMAIAGNLLKKAAQKVRQLPAGARELIGGKKKPDITRLVTKNRQALQTLNQGVSKGWKAARQQFNPQNFQTYSRQKKFFTIAAAVLLIALIANIAVASHYRSVRASREQFDKTIGEVQKDLNDATASLLYHADAQAHTLFAQARTKLDGLAAKGDDQQKKVEDLKKELNEIQVKLEKRVDVNPSVVATLGSADRLIVLPAYFATETNRTIISYDRRSGKVQDDILRSSEKILASASFKDAVAATYNGRELTLWNTSSGGSSNAFNESVPAEGDAVGLEYYSPNTRVYTIDKKLSRVTSFLVGDKGFSKPVISVANANVSEALDLAVDGNVYVLSTGGVTKYQSGSQADFNNQYLRLPLDSHSKIFATKDTKNLYVLNSASGLISVLDKKGELLKTLASQQLVGAKDFTVDEAGKAIYVLNNDSLLKVNF